MPQCPRRRTWVNVMMGRRTQGRYHPGSCRYRIRVLSTFSCLRRWIYTFLQGLSTRRPLVRLFVLHLTLVVVSRKWPVTGRLWTSSWRGVFGVWKSQYRHTRHHTRKGFFRYPYSDEFRNPRIEKIPFLRPRSGKGLTQDFRPGRGLTVALFLLTRPLKCPLSQTEQPKIWTNPGQCEKMNKQG